MSIIKICGLKDARSAITAAENGANLLGFIFAPSHRQVVAKDVAAIVAEIRARGYSTPAVGVFVDPDPDQLADDIRVSGIDVVQLSGEESPDLMRHIPLDLIKAFPAGDDEDFQGLRDHMAKWAGAKHVMLDASAPNARGGTGKRANWTLASLLAQHIPLILAGGLDPDNVIGAIGAVNPFGVDVSSGIETDGAKDQDKIIRFIRNARVAFDARVS